MITQFFFNPAVSDTTPRVPVGTLVELGPDVNAASPRYGHNVYMYVYNGSGSAWQAGKVINQATGTKQAQGVVAAGPGSSWFTLGIAMDATPAGSYGWVCCDGRVQAQGNGSVAAGDVCVADSNGRLAPIGSSSVDNALGYALEADGAAGDLFWVRIKTRG